MNAKGVLSKGRPFQLLMTDAALSRSSSFACCMGMASIATRLFPTETLCQNSSVGLEFFFRPRQAAMDLIEGFLSEVHLF